MSKKINKIAIVRVSPKAGNVKHLWIYEERSNGWIRGGTEQSDSSGRTFSSWHAPHHILKVVDLGTVHAELGPYDWNGIQPGTMVEYWGGSFRGIIIGRTGAKYDILPIGDSKPISTPWETVVPVALEE